MPLWFQNFHTDTVYISLLWFDASCSPQPWRKIGWFSAAPQAKIEVVSGDLRDLSNREFGWFAESGGADGPSWSGDRWYKVPHNAAFNQCYDDDTGCNAVWPFHVGRLNEEWLGLTVLLVAPGAANRANQGCAWGSPLFPPDPPPPPPPPPPITMVNVVTTSQNITFNINTNNFNSNNVNVNSIRAQSKQPGPLVEIIDQAILYFESTRFAEQGQLVVVGGGIRAIADMTLDAEAQIRAAQKVLYCVADPVTERRLHALNSSAESLYGLYGNDKPRTDTYLEMVKAILSPVRAGLRVCVVYYGHPGVFAWPTHEAVRIARREGFRAEMHPGISADASLFADLGLDPSQPGCHSLEATDFLVHRRSPDVSAHFLLWQVECVGDFGFNFSGYKRHNFHILLERLRMFYPTTHPVIIYEATQMPQGRPKIIKSSLESITKDDLTGISTLYLPPASTLEIDIEMCRRLGIAQTLDIESRDSD